MSPPLGLGRGGLGLARSHLTPPRGSRPELYDVAPLGLGGGTLRSDAVVRSESSSRLPHLAPGSIRILSVSMS